MALYKYPSAISQINDTAFDTIWNPGATPPHGGIYRCTGCGKEIASNTGVQLPPQNHHQHSSTQGQVRWQMTVYADPKP